MSENAPDRSQEPKPDIRVEDIRKQARNGLEKLHAQTDDQKAKFQEINYGSHIPVSEGAVLKAKLGERPATWEQVKESFQKKEYSVAIKQLFSMLFTSGPEGLNHFMEAKDQIPPYQAYGILKQLEHANPAKQTLRDKALGSIVGGQLRTELHKKYAKEAPSTVTEFVDVTEDTKLESIMKARPNGENVWKEMIQTAEYKGKQEEVLLGVLRYDKPLPKGSRVFFNDKGYPVWLSFQKVDPKTVPPVDVYRRKKEIAEKSKDEETMEALKATLKPGHVILTGPNRKGTQKIGKVFQWGIRNAGDKEVQDAELGVTHAMYFDGKDIHHMNPGGWSMATPEDMFMKDGAKNKYKTATILQVPEGTEKDYVANMQKRIEAYRKANPKYGYGTIGGVARNRVTGRTDRIDDKNDKTCICTDAPAEGAKGVKGLEDMANANVPAKLIGKNVTVLASFEFEREG